MAKFVVNFYLIVVSCKGSTSKNLGGGGGNSTYYVTGTCHFAQKIGTHNFVNSGGF